MANKKRGKRATDPSEGTFGKTLKEKSAKKQRQSWGEETLALSSSELLWHGIAPGISSAEKAFITDATNAHRGMLLIIKFRLSQKTAAPSKIFVNVLSKRVSFQKHRS